MNAGSSAGHVLDGARLALPGREEVVPRQLAVARRAGRVAPLAGRRRARRRSVRQSIASSTIDEQVDVLALAVGDVGRQHEARAARPDPVAQRARPEAGEDDAVDRPDPDASPASRRSPRPRSACRSSTRSPLPIPRPRSAGGDPLDLGEQLGVGERAPPAALVQRDQGRRVASTRRDVAIERIRGEVRPAAREPGEARPLARLEGAFRLGGSNRVARRPPARTSSGSLSERRYSSS